jgi:hypothetical protein
MFKSLSSRELGHLWTHQRDALKHVLSHLNSKTSPFLVRMPTGSGKTGVIACLSRLCNPGTTLVLTPWAYLRDQLVDQVESRFWLQTTLKPLTGRVVAMKPSEAGKVIAGQDVRVIICTLATLHALWREEGVLFDKLAKKISLAIVDEGHYEPAVEWAKAVKALRTKTLLLTATPYRNDLKLFRIRDADKATYQYTHEQALKDRVIRSVTFESLPDQVEIVKLARAFQRWWKQANSSGLLPSKEPRAIICCATAEDIEQTVTALRTANLRAIGVHERFSQSHPFLQQRVPPPRQSSFDIWVHENKLTEGLDDDRFCCLVLFTRITNDRTLVQQVGRILRKDPTDRPGNAVVLAPKQYDLSERWNAYLAFEPHLSLVAAQHYRTVVDSLLQLQPDAEYFGGRFRARFDVGTLAANPQVVIAPSVVVREIAPAFDLTDYIEDCTDTLNLKDAFILGPDPYSPCQRSAKHALWVYATVRNSPHLRNRSFYEIRLQTHCIVVNGGYAFISDTQGSMPVEYVEAHSSRVSPQTIARYLGTQFRPTHVSTSSSIPYDSVVRAADYRSHDLRSIPASLTDRIQICRRARGVSKEGQRRYVGLDRSRLREELPAEARGNFDVTSFIAWTNSVSSILNSKKSPGDFFERYMPVITPPKRSAPKIISLDLHMDLEITGADGQERRVVNSAVDISFVAGDVFRCTFEFEGKNAVTDKIDLRITYEPLKQRFWFTKEGGATIRVRSTESGAPEARSLAEFLNANQELILLAMTDGETVYQARTFYKIDYDRANVTLLETVASLSKPKCSTEKGTAAQISKLKQQNSKSFPPQSTFRAIAQGQIPLPISDELLICDDMGTECADFVSANFKEKQLALIHSKVPPKSHKISASAFHEVVAQAMKNLVYFTQDANVPKGAASWVPQSTWKGTKVPTLLRSPSGFPVGRALWQKIKTDIIKTSNPEFFVVLVTAGCCDVSALRTAAADRTKRTPETAQLLHLLDGLNAYARQLGVRVRIYDLPFVKSD